MLSTNGIDETVKRLRRASFSLISREREAVLHDRQTFEGEVQCRADWDAYRILSHLADLLSQIQSTQFAITREQWETGRKRDLELFARFAEREAKYKAQKKVLLTRSFGGKHNDKLHEITR